MKNAPWLCYKYKGATLTDVIIDAMIKFYCRAIRGLSERGELL
jgi:hypothetical protein